MSSVERVRGKFTVNRIVRQRGSCLNDNGNWGPCELQTVELGVVLGGSKEDQNFASATPAGQVSLSISRPEVVNFFELNEAYYVDFSPVPPPTEN